MQVLRLRGYATPLRMTKFREVEKDWERTTKHKQHHWSLLRTENRHLTTHYILVSISTLTACATAMAITQSSCEPAAAPVLPLGRLL